MSNKSRGFSAWGRLTGLFSRPKTPQWLVIEIEKGTPVQAGGDEAAIVSLANHPGFIALTNRMKLMRAVLESQLKRVRHSDIRDVDFLQLGITWLGFLEHEVAAATKSLKAKSATAPTFDEIAAFEKVRSFIESVGPTSPKE